MKRIDITENGINIVFSLEDNGQIKLMHFSALPFNEQDIWHEMFEQDFLGCFDIAQVEIAGLDRPCERHGTKYIVTAPGYRLKYKGFSDTRDDIGRLIKITQFDEPTGIEVISTFRFYDGISVVRCFTEVINTSPTETYTLTYVSSFNYLGIEKEGVLPRDEKFTIKIPHNSWQKEMLWQDYTFEQLGMPQSQKDGWEHCGKAINVTNIGNWSTNEYLPMGYIQNNETNSGLFWQIEHNGSWHWEISDQRGHFYLALSGPNEQQSHWFKNLAPGESFTSVHAAVGVCSNFDEGMGELTKYRRVIRRKNTDNEKLGVIFNDYMNCLWGDPTEEKEMPLIRAAAEAGCEYYCIDCGWYADGFWWDSVGEWQENRRRFPNGLKKVTDEIRKYGMIPGVWLEIEVMGINCELAKKAPDEWFFMRHGKRVYDRSRYQLDFSNPEVSAYADSVIDRLVKDYGVGYIKMDYNIEPGIGTEVDCDSVGEGLMRHEKAYLSWLDGVFRRYPELIIENCSSGGMRIDYAMLSRYSIQSTSDQDDYRRYATIAANAPTGLTPEQSAIWSYPLTDGDREEVVFNMVNAMTQRIHQSGHLANLSLERKALVKEAIDCYKRIRNDIKISVPFWPIGLSHIGDEWVVLGLRTESKAYIAVWRREGTEKRCEIPIKYAGENTAVRCIYPSFEQGCHSFDSTSKMLSVELDRNYSARLFEAEL